MANTLNSWLKQYYLVAIAVWVFVVCSLINQSFLTPFSINSLLLEIAIFGFLVLGQSLVILSGGIDLSVGNMASMSSVVAAWLMILLKDLLSPIQNLPVTIVLTVGLCASLGHMTGWFVSRLKIPPLIATLGTMWVVQGISYFFLKGVPTGYPIKTFGLIFSGSFGTGRSWLSAIPFSFIYLLVASIVIVVLLKKFRWGREIYATGGNAYAAFISGVDTARVQRRVYMLSGLFAGIAGLLVGAFSAVGYPRAANGYELYTVAAVVMGGIKLSGGEGELHNALIGIFIIRLLNKLVIFAGISSYYEGMIIGTIIIVMLIIGSKEKSAKKRPAEVERQVGR